MSIRVAEAVMEEIPVRRKRSRPQWWLLPIALLGLLLAFVVLRERRAGERASETRTTGATVACKADQACADRELCVDGACREISASTAECERVTVHFSSGASTFSPQHEGEVTRAARCLKMDANTKVFLAGLADPPAVDADALVRARRTALRNALQKNGVSEDQLQSIGR